MAPLSKWWLRKPQTSTIWHWAKKIWHSWWKLISNNAKLFTQNILGTTNLLCMGFLWSLYRIAIHSFMSFSCAIYKFSSQAHSAWQFHVIGQGKQELSPFFPRGGVRQYWQNDSKILENFLFTFYYPYIFILAFVKSNEVVPNLAMYLFTNLWLNPFRLFSQNFLLAQILTNRS